MERVINIGFERGNRHERQKRNQPYGEICFYSAHILSKHVIKAHVKCAVWKVLVNYPVTCLELTRDFLRCLGGD